MSMGYIDLPVVTDSDVILQQALANMIAAFPGWVPREGNLEVALLEQFALLVAEAATVASNVPATIFAYYGGLIGISPLPGTAETITVTYTLASAASGSPGYQLPAGTIIGFYFAGAAYQFATVQDYLIPTGQSSIAMTLQAVTVGSDYNLDVLAATSDLNLTSLYLALQYPDPLVSNILLASTPATNTNLVVGTNPEPISAYLNRLNAELQLLAPRPITSSDYAQFSQNVAGIFRALAIDGINPFTNWFSVTNANLTLAQTSGSAPTGWAGIGDGTHNAGLSTPGTAPSNYVAATTSSTALTNAVAVEAATLAGATSITITTGTGTAISTSVSGTNPALVLITDATNGNEIIVVTTAAATTGSGASTQQVLTSATGMLYPHGTSATATCLQGAALPLVGASPGSAGTIAPNANYYMASAVVECGSDTTATAVPYIVSLTTYIDGSTAVVSSCSPTATAGFDYTGNTKTIHCEIPVSNALSSSALAPSAVTTYDTIKPSLVSVQSYVVWGSAGTSKTHFIYYADVFGTPWFFGVGGQDTPSITNSFWNHIPDSNLASYNFANAAIGSWTVPTGLVAIPGYGIQFPGTGAALGSALTAISQIFRLSNIASDVSGTTRTYTLFATVDASSTGITYGDVSLEVWDMSTGAVLVASGSLTVTVSPTSATIATISLPFTLSAAKDVEVRIVFGTGLNVPVNSSVMVSQIGIMGGNQTANYCVTNNDLGYSWTAGGLYSTSIFNYARMVSICPVTVEGLGASASLTDALLAYLAARREVNFLINVIQPAYFPVDVAWSGYVLPGYAVATVQSAVNAAIQNFLSPANWGGGLSSPPSWDGSQTTIRILDIAGVISDVAGMGSITSVTIRPSWPTSGAYGTSNLIMPGVASLPIANNITATLLTNPSDAFSGLS